MLSQIEAAVKAMAFAGSALELYAFACNRSQSDICEAPISRPVEEGYYLKILSSTILARRIA
jgi:hypothetical protein